MTRLEILKRRLCLSDISDFAYGLAKNIFEAYEAELKAKDEEIAKLKNNHTAINSDDYWIQNQN